MRKLGEGAPDLGNYRPVKAGRKQGETGARGYPPALLTRQVIYSVVTRAMSSLLIQPLPSALRIRFARSVTGRVNPQSGGYPPRYIPVLAMLGNVFSPSFVLGLGKVWEELSLDLLARRVFADNCVVVGMVAVRASKN